MSDHEWMHNMVSNVMASPVKNPHLFEIQYKSHMFISPEEQDGGGCE